MTIQEQVSALQVEILSFLRKSTSIEGQIQQLENNRSAEIQAQSNRYEKKRKDLLAQKDEIAKIYRVAKENTEEQLGGRSRSKPDLALLNSLIYSINPNSRNDAVATRIVRLCDQYLQYVDNELSTLSQMLQSDIKKTDDEISKKINELRKKQKNLLSSFESYLMTTDFARLGERIDSKIKTYAIPDAGKIVITKHVQKAKKIVFGFKEISIQTVPELDSVLSRFLGKYYDTKKKAIIIPVGLNTNHSRTISIRYYDKNEDAIENGIQTLLINCIRYLGPDNIIINLVDTIHYSDKLYGQLSVFIGDKKALLQMVPQSEKDIEALLSSLTIYYRTMESSMGSKTLFEYNEQNQRKLPIRLIIINRARNTYDSQDSQMSYLINNSEKLGIFFIILEKDSDHVKINISPSRSTKRQLVIQGQPSGEFYLLMDSKDESFVWNEYTGKLSRSFIDSVNSTLQSKKRSTEYFSNFEKCIPTRSTGKRRPIQVPFALDDEDNIVVCPFEEDNFAAYMMGAARSGKTTLLHTIICGLIMNYHPDEVELWMMDFKMVEFSLYLDFAPPHIKYLLLEKSEDLVFDILDQLTIELERRERIFSKNGWVKLTDVPTTVYMPAIIVIIDEFAQMSQIIMETSINGLAKNYTLKLENLLSKGAALGFKFIFASQTYSDGVVGLTQTARKQIQVRFALKNVEEEIRETLLLSSSTSEYLNQQIRALPQYETIFRRTDSEGKTSITHLRNMYVTKDEAKDIITQLRRRIIAVTSETDRNDQYKNKSPVLIDGAKPNSFESQKTIIISHEQKDPYELSDGEVYIYPGVKCSFNPLAYFVLRKANMENMLLCDGIPEYRMSVLLSIMKSYKRRGGKIEVWVDNSSLFYRRYRMFFEKIDIYVGSLAIGKRILELQNRIKEKEDIASMVICLGYENLIDEFESIEIEDIQDLQSQDSNECLLERLRAIEDQLSQCAEEELGTLLEEYERLRSQYNGIKGDDVYSRESQTLNEEIRQTAMTMVKLLKRCGIHGLHFLFCFDSADDYTQLKMQPVLFRHKMVFSISEDASYDILGSKIGSKIGGAVFIYNNGKSSMTCRPHLHRRLGLDGWKINEDGKIIQEA